MDSILFFKAYCKFKNLGHRYAIGCLDTNGTKCLKLFNDELSKHLMYEGRALVPGALYKIYAATCGTESGCSVGKPKQSCIGKCYSKNKCAVYSFDPIDLDTFVYELTQEEFNKFITILK